MTVFINITDHVVNSQVSAVLSLDSTSGAVHSDLYKGTTLQPANQVTVSRLDSNGTVSVSFTPTSTGVYTVLADGVVVLRVEVISKSMRTYLQNIEDEALGSWQWDKTAGSLTLLRQDGTSLGNFNITDTLDSSSRERL